MLMSMQGGGEFGDGAPLRILAKPANGLAIIVEHSDTGKWRSTAYAPPGRAAGNEASRLCPQRPARVRPGRVWIRLHYSHVWVGVNLQ
jgi:hypothetical protein